MNTKNPVVETPMETLNVKTVSAAAAAAAALVDADRLNLAIADHSNTVSEIKSHRSELANLQTQIKELDDEITKLGSQLKDFDLNNHSIGIADIKSFAQQKLKTQYEIESLAEVRDELKKKYPIMERDYSYLDSTSESEKRRACWNVLYNGLLKSIDTEALKQLIVVGVASGRSERMVMNDLNLNTIEYERLDALIKQFGIPV